MFDPGLYYELARQRSDELIAEADAYRLGSRLRRIRARITHGGRRHHTKAR